MKVLHVTSRDCSGGAGRAAYRLHCSLREIGIESRMLVRRKSSDDSTVSVSGSKSWIQDWLEKLTPPFERFLRRWFGHPTGSNWSFGILPNRLVSQINASDADLVHLHWLGDGYLPVKALASINKPVCWTLHDLWPILGVGHYDDAEPGAKGGLVTIDWEGRFRRIKRRCWGDLNVHAIGPSPWVISEMKSRGERPGWTGHVVPHGLDLELFRSVSSEELAKRLGIDRSRPILVFGALGATTSRRKGGDLIEDALRHLSASRSNLQLVVFGDRPEDRIESHGFDLFRVGMINDNESLAEIYSLGDVFLFPSREETFGQTASESLSCGTPVVGFRAAGQESVFRHQKEGYFAEPFSVTDFARGIEWVVAQKEKGHPWEKVCRDFALENFPLKKYAEEHRRIYETVLRTKAEL